MSDQTTLLVWTAVIAVGTVVLAIVTTVLAIATAKYTRLLRQANVSAYFEASGNWINLVIQNTGTGTAHEVLFDTDLTPEERAEIYGPNKHGPRYIVFESLDFLQHVTQLAPGERLTHRWLYRWLALRDNKPHPWTLRIAYVDAWGRRHCTKIPFSLKKFGDWDGTHVMEPPPLESIAESLRILAEGPDPRGDA